MTTLLRAWLRGVGQTLITLGLVVLLFCAYLLWGTGLVTAREQTRLADDLRRAWTAPVPAAEQRSAPRVPSELRQGAGLALLHIPSLAGYDPWIVVEGTSVQDLKKGPGHIPGTALPGEVGNVVISGHRTTYGAPFERLDELGNGSRVVLETAEGWYTYTVEGKSIVAPTAVEVTYAVPGQPNAKPVERLLTMTTCHPKYSARLRLIVRATLTGERSRADGPPPGLQP